VRASICGTFTSKPRKQSRRAPVCLINPCRWPPSSPYIEVPAQAPRRSSTYNLNPPNGSKALHRRRRKNRHERFLNPRKFLVQLFRDCHAGKISWSSAAQMASSPRTQFRKFGAVRESMDRKSRKTRWRPARPGVRPTRYRKARASPLLCGPTSRRSAIVRMPPGNCLSCVGTNPPRHLAEADAPSNAISPAINHQRDSGGTYRMTNKRPVLFLTPTRKNRLKPLKNQPNMNSNARENRSFFASRELQEQRRQRRAQAQRVERRNSPSKISNRQRELFVELSRKPNDERRRPQTPRHSTNAIAIIGPLTSAHSRAALLPSAASPTSRFSFGRSPPPQSRRPPQCRLPSNQSKQRKRV